MSRRLLFLLPLKGRKIRLRRPKGTAQSAFFKEGCFRSNVQLYIKSLVNNKERIGLGRDAGASEGTPAPAFSAFLQEIRNIRKDQSAIQI